MFKFKKKCKHKNSEVIYISHESDRFYKKKCRDCGKTISFGGDNGQEDRVYDFLIQNVANRIEPYASCYLVTNESVI